MASSKELDALLGTMPKWLLDSDTAGHETITPHTLAGAAEEADPNVDDSLGPTGLPRVTLAGSSGVPGQLDLQDVLGQGGMGVVRLANQRALGRAVAVKTLHEGKGATAGASDLVEEARVMGQLEHPAVVPIHMLGEDANGRPLVVMKRIDGITWTELARTPDHPLWDKFERGSTDAEAHHLRIFMQICHALEFAHEHRILHRDVKPENVMVGGFGEVHLLDWGIALRLDERDAERSRGVVGTPACMAPEMLWGEPAKLDERTDVFLLGATLYEVLTGRPRHAGRRVPAILVAALDCEPPQFESGEVAEELADILRRTTAADKEARPRGVRELRVQIADYLEHRASLHLTQRAQADAENLDATIAGAAKDESLRPRVVSLFNSCRQAFWLALDVWSENETARAGLSAVLGTMADFYIETRQEQAAAALLEELGDDARPDQRVCLEQLQRELADERNAQSRLSSLFRELDPTVARHERMTLLLALGVGALVVTVALAGLRMRGVDMMSPVALFGLAAAFLTAYAGGVFVARRQVLITRLNRRIVLGVGVLLVALVLNRAVALLTGVPANLILVYDTLALTIVALVGSVTIERQIGWFVPVCLLGLAVAAWRPDTSQVIFPSLSMLTMIGIAIWHRSQRRSAGTSPTVPPVT